VKKLNKEEKREIEEIREKARPVLIKYGAAHAGIFGSAARGKMTDKSDVDIYVEFPENKHLGLKFITIIFELEKALEKKVDLVECSAGSAPVKKEILKHQVPIL